MKKVISVLLSVILLTVSLNLFLSADNEQQVTVLFTHDLHSHLLPGKDDNGIEYGGYARLMTAIKAQKELYPNALLVDGGDFSMGSLFQTAYTTSAIELRMLGHMGYDATTFGNHEFDYLPEGLMNMLDAASKSGDNLPKIVNSNYRPNESDKEYINALEENGVTEYILIERGGAYFVIFGLMGFDSDECAPNSGMILEDPFQASERIVSKAVKECQDLYNTDPVVVCLSHSGTDGSKGEDYELAEKVDGIDIIVSGHTHTTLDEPINVNDTYIVSAGEYGKYLGVIRLSVSDKGTALSGYELIPIDKNIAQDPETSLIIENFKTNVEKDYLSKYNMTFDEVLTENNYKFDTVDAVYATPHESTLCNLFSDAYKWAVEETTGEEVDMALTAAGVIRGTLPIGKITVSDVFNAASLGVGTEGELVSIYLTGRDLKNAFEVDASVQPLMSSAQLFMSGVEYSFNTNRMIFNKVDYSALRKNDGTLEKIDDSKLYRVVAGMYCGQMLGAVESTSFGLISITPRDSEGNPIAVEDLVDHVVKDKDGNPLKEWYAISSYLKSMGGSVDEKYSGTDGRKQIYSSFKPTDMLRNANKFTYIIIAVILVIVASIATVAVVIVKRRKRNRKTA